jgi:hypothetical protein
MSASASAPRTPTREELLQRCCLLSAAVVCPTCSTLPLAHKGEVSMRIGEAPPEPRATAPGAERCAAPPQPALGSQDSGEPTLRCARRSRPEPREGPPVRESPGRAAAFAVLRERDRMSWVSTVDVAGRRRSPATTAEFHRGRTPGNKGMRYPADPPREVGMDDWGWERLRPWLQRRSSLPVGPLFCVIDGATRRRLSAQLRSRGVPCSGAGAVRSPGHGPAASAKQLR